VANPEIELYRGGGWTESLWREASPILAEAARLADNGIEALGVVYSSPKHGTVRRFKSQGLTQYAGQSYGKVNFDLNVVLQSHDDWPVSQLSGSWSSTTLHEAIHNTRCEHHHIDEMYERMASEALAYLGEYLFATECSDGMIAPTLSKQDLRYNPVLGAKFRQIVATPPDHETHKKWYEEITVHDYLSDAELHGIQRVYGQIQAGFEFNDLMRLPAQEALDL
jgi:hypothetical protein